MTYTLAITSCGRHDLLLQTITSFLQCVQNNPTETIILEDGPAPAPAWLDTLKPKLGNVRWINNVERMGQSYSIDRLYSEIKTELIFWCEDDWEFHESGFLNASFAILRDHPEISMVALRSDWNHPYVQQNGLLIAEPYWMGVWGGTCWNPGLRRLSDYKRFGSYGKHVGYGVEGLSHEKDWSKLHLDQGYRIAALPRHCRHIGGGRSRAIEPVRRIPRILIAVPACEKFDYGRWESSESPHYNPAHPAYGTDIHVSGDNPRVDAVRNTWFRDVEVFGDRVVARFFYGRPGPRTPSADSVLLDVEDNYAALPAKTRAICEWALANDFDYVFKCDDDTAVYVDRLVREVLEHRFDYAGYTHCNVCTGGPGYFLSRRGMRAVVVGGTADHWAEDVWTSKCVTADRINPCHLSGHTPGYAAHWIWPNGFDPKILNNDIVTLHAVQPEVMREWYEHKNKVK